MNIAEIPIAFLEISYKSSKIRPGVLRDLQSAGQRPLRRGALQRIPGRHGELAHCDARPAAARRLPTLRHGAAEFKETSTICISYK